MIEEARRLETLFENAALDPETPVLVKRLALSRLIREMFETATDALRQGDQGAELFSDYVLDLFVRPDLAPRLLEQGFGGCDNLNYAELMDMAAQGQEMLDEKLPPLDFRLPH